MKKEAFAVLDQTQDFTVSSQKSSSLKHGGGGDDDDDADCDDFYPTVLSLAHLGGGCSIMEEAPTDDCYICFDVDGSLLAVKDMRSWPSTTTNEAAADPTDGYPHSSTAPSPNGTMGMLCRGKDRWDVLPRRQIKLLQPGDQLCTSLIVKPRPEWEESDPSAAARAAAFAREWEGTKAGGLVLEYQYSARPAGATSLSMSPSSTARRSRTQHHRYRATQSQQDVGLYSQPPTQSQSQLQSQSDISLEVTHSQLTESRDAVADATEEEFGTQMTCTQPSSEADMDEDNDSHDSDRTVEIVRLSQNQEQSSDDAGTMNIETDGSGLCDKEQATAATVNASIDNGDDFEHGQNMFSTQNLSSKVEVHEDDGRNLVRGRGLVGIVATQEYGDEQPEGGEVLRIEIGESAPRLSTQPLDESEDETSVTREPGEADGIRKSTFSPGELPGIPENLRPEQENNGVRNGGFEGLPAKESTGPMENSDDETTVENDGRMRQNTLDAEGEIASGRLSNDWEASDSVASQRIMQFELSPSLLQETQDPPSQSSPADDGRDDQSINLLLSDTEEAPTPSLPEQMHVHVLKDSSESVQTPPTKSWVGVSEEHVLKMQGEEPPAEIVNLLHEADDESFLLKADARNEAIKHPTTPNICKTPQPHPDSPSRSPALLHETGRNKLDDEDIVVAGNLDSSAACADGSSTGSSTAVDGANETKDIQEEAKLRVPFKDPDLLMPESDETRVVGISTDKISARKTKAQLSSSSQLHVNAASKGNMCSAVDSGRDEQTHESVDGGRQQRFPLNSTPSSVATTFVCPPHNSDVCSPLAAAVADTKESHEPFDATNITIPDRVDALPQCNLSLVIAHSHESDFDPSPSLTRETGESILAPASLEAATNPSRTENLTDSNVDCAGIVSDPLRTKMISADSSASCLHQSNKRKRTEMDTPRRSSKRLQAVQNTPTEESRLKNISFKETPMASSAVNMAHDVGEEDCIKVADARYRSRFQDALSDKIVRVLTSNLTESDEDLLKTLCTGSLADNVRMRTTDAVGKKTTLCIMAVEDEETDNVRPRARTIKAMRCALAGIPIVTPGWLRACETTRVAVEPSKFVRSLPTKMASIEKTGEAKFGVSRLATAWSIPESTRQLLFSNMFAFLVGNFGADKRLTFCQLLKEGGAKIISGTPELSSRLTALVKNPMDPMKIILLCGDSGLQLPISVEKDVKGILSKKTGRVLIVDTRWVVESVTCAKCMPAAYFQIPKKKGLWKMCS